VEGIPYALQVKFSLPSQAIPRHEPDGTQKCPPHVGVCRCELIVPLLQFPRASALGCVPHKSQGIELLIWCESLSGCKDSADDTPSMNLWIIKTGSAPAIIYRLSPFAPSVGEEPFCSSKERTSACLVRFLLARSPLPKKTVSFQLPCNLLGLLVGLFNVVFNAKQGLERLCRYGARGALALERLSRTEDGRITYRVKRPLPDGTTHLFFTRVSCGEVCPGVQDRLQGHSASPSTMLSATFTTNSSPRETVLCPATVPEAVNRRTSPGPPGC